MQAANAYRQTVEMPLLYGLTAAVLISMINFLQAVINLLAMQPGSQYYA